jgi:hypothetical protein
MIATIKVIRKDPDVAPSYDQQTETWTGGFPVIFTGQARIQPYGIIGDQIVAQDTTGRRLMRVQIENLTSNINLDDMIMVTACDNDPELLSFSLEVRGTIGSSNSWVTDLVCEANMKRNI